MDNIILMTDSYKVTHYKQYPEGTEKVYSYFESRGGESDKTVFFGLQYFILKYLSGKVITKEKIDEAELIFKGHFGGDVFNREGWEYILNEHDGKLPLKITAVPEGSVVDISNVLITVENTDPKCYWLTNYVETLLVQTWYPMTVCTESYKIKKLIKDYLEQTGDISGLPFKLHDFGFRGVSSVESASIGGAAHLVNFLGSDTMVAMTTLRDYYGAIDPTSYSIPATEHSTITSWGRDNELDAYRNILNQYPTGLVACVSDSYDIYHACEQYWGTDLKDQILSRDGTLIIRPDSGNPVTVLNKILNILGDKFGYSINSKNYKVLPSQIRVIQGDGCDFMTLRTILFSLTNNGWSTDNIAFGMGGGLLQKLHRDTQMCAFKCSQVVVNGEEREVYKSPITSKAKESKKGRLVLIKDADGNYTTKKYDSVTKDKDQLKTVFLNGEAMNIQHIDDIRTNAKI